jgi:AraC family transcriptional activator of tynA and feaB
MTVTHTPRHVAHVDPDEIFVCRQTTGQLTLEQNSREVVLRSGDITLLDPRLPYTGRFARDSRTLVVKLPRRLLEARIGETRVLTALSVSSAEPEGSLTSAVLAMLPAYSNRLSATLGTLVSENVLDLIAVLVTRLMEERSPRISSARSLALMNIRAAIEARLTDSELDTATAAAAAGVSVRYANAVLAKQGTSIMRLILARRLERCSKALEDPSQMHRKISEIAYGWGFSDMTHFGRTFRAAYGCLPSEYRRRAKPNHPILRLVVPEKH